MDSSHPPVNFIEPPDFDPPAAPPPPPRPRPWRVRAVVVAVALVVAAAGTGLGTRAWDSNGTTTANDVAATAPSSETLPTVAPAPATTTLDTDDIAARVDPAVVDIDTRFDGGGGGAGTGMVLTPSGLVLTNSHVIEGATRIAVQIAGTGPTHAAHVVGYDTTHDVAVIQIEDVSGLATITVGDPSTLRVGDRVVAVGNALGASGPHAVSAGSIDALNRTITAGNVTGSAETLHGLIQVDATLRPGDSGGPLVNGAGQVIGMNTASSVGRRRSVGPNVGFAIPIDDAMAIARQIQAGERSATVHIGDRAILGVRITQTAGFGADGVRVAAVDGDGPAAGAGIRSGDLITAVDGTTVSSVDDLTAALDRHSPGDRVRVGWTTTTGAARAATVQLAVGPPA
jgi:S1-C subfamily serine protease